MSARRSDYTEVLVDKLFLEAFANEESAYHSMSTAPSLSDRLAKFRKKLIWHINNSLSKRQNEVIHLYLSGKKEREIAAILGITQQVVNIYKHRAIKKLQKVIVF